MFKLAALVQILLFSALMVGCGKPADQKADEAVARGEAALRGDDPAKAMSEFRSAVEQAEKAKKKDPNFNVQPYHDNVGRAQGACADKSRRLLNEARAIATSNPEAAMEKLSEAESLASARYGNAPEVVTQVTQVASSQELAPAMARRQMDEYTRGINSWLFSRDQYSTNYGNYFEARSWYDLVEVKTRLENTLRNWQHPTGTTALTQLGSLMTAFELWRVSARLSYEPTQGQGILLMIVLDKHAALRATLMGRESINYWLLEQHWGIRSRGTGNGGTGNGYDWVGTGSGTGSGGTGSGGTGNGTSGTGGGGTGNGTSSTGGTGNGRPSTGGTGGGSTSTGGTGNGTSRPSTGGTGGGTSGGSTSGGTRGTGNGGTSRDEFGDINRSSGGTGGGTSGGSTSGGSRGTGGTTPRTGTGGTGN